MSTPRHARRPHTGGGPEHPQVPPRTCPRGQVRSRRAPVLAAIIGLGLAAPACAIERGRGWDTPAPPVAAAPAAPTVSLLLLGEAGFPGPTTAATAAEVARTLDDHRRRRVATIVLWLGDAVGPDGLGCPTSADPWAREGVAELARVVRTHQVQGGSSYAVLGAHEWRCGRPELAFQTAQVGPHPWSLPAANYVVRVARDGATRVVSFCSGNLCTVEPPADGTLVELVVLDTTAWLAPPPEAAAAVQASLSQQQALLATLELTATASAPRLLVTHHPIETAGPHGQGGLFPDSAYFLHADAVRRAVDRGLFAGVLSGHDRSLSGTRDITDAVKRSSRHWLKHPVFQVVSGGAARPDGAPAGGRRGWVYYQGQALKPDLLSNRAGFAEVVVTPTDFAARLHQRKAGRWRTAEVRVPHGRPPHPVETPSPVMDPCLHCDPVPPRR
jgi:hypothetical protein